jgi:hypothetical protein
LSTSSAAHYPCAAAARALEHGIVDDVQESGIASRYCGMYFVKKSYVMVHFSSRPGSARSWI